MSFIALIFGLIIGSFLNVCIYRLPRKESIINPGSHCPKCNRPLQVIDLIPIISFIIYRGKCRYCRQKISWQYPIVELITGLIFFLIVEKYGISLKACSYLIISAIAIVAAFIDLHWQIIPNTLVLFGLGLGIIIIIFLRPFSWSPLLGFLAGGLIMLALYIFSGGMMGLGDVKYMALIGLYIGWPTILMVMLLSYTIGAVISLFLLLARLKKMKDAIPLGPFISLGAIITIIWGPKLLYWYLSFFNLL